MLDESPSIAHVQSIATKAQNRVQLVTRITQFLQHILQFLTSKGCVNEDHRATLPFLTMRLSTSVKPVYGDLLRGLS